MSASRWCKVALLPLAWACAQNQSGWGNPAILKALRLAADDVASVSIYLDRCQRESRSFPAARTADLLSMLGSLPPAPGVGVQEAWEVWLFITIETNGSGSFEVSIGTRRSLDGASDCYSQPGYEARPDRLLRSRRASGDG